MLVPTSLVLVIVGASARKITECTLVVANSQITLPDGSSSQAGRRLFKCGRIWARTGCVVQDGVFQCLTGQCGPGTGGDVTCVNADQPPATLAEFTLATSGEDNYDISLVDGFNVPMNIIASIDSCPQPKCTGNINPLCPPVLRTGLDENGVNLGCMTACNAGYGQETFGNRACCTGLYNDPNLCAICGVDYYHLFKDNCEMAYAYAYDEKSKTALWTCPSSSGKLSDYTVEFCPEGTDYVGSKEPQGKYLDATATCKSLATNTLGAPTFSVGASPTSTATRGTLKVTATVATGLDGAAAIGLGPGPSLPASPSSASMSSEATTSEGTLSPASTGKVGSETLYPPSAPPSQLSQAAESSGGTDHVVHVTVTEVVTKTGLGRAPAQTDQPGNFAAAGPPQRAGEGHKHFGAGQWLMPHKRSKARRKRLTF